MTAIDRRKFVKATSATGALAWLSASRPAVGQISAAQPSGYLTSVPFVLDPALSGLSQADLTNLFQVRPNYTAAQQAAIYPQSIASGDPRPNGVVLWSRVDPSQQTAASDDVVAWQMGTSASFTAGTVLIEGVAMLTEATDNTVKIPVSNTVLQPFTQYYYRFLFNGVPGRPIPAKELGLAVSAISPTLRAANPWIEFFNSQTHGYGLLTFTPIQLTCVFKNVSTITSPTSTLSTLATFTVPVNKVQLIQS